MIKSTSGAIPQKITYYYSVEKKVFTGTSWDHNLSDFGPEPLAITENVLPAFPVDSNNKVTSNTAIKWAECLTDSNNKRAGFYKSIEVDNIPIKNVRILSIENRQSNSVYKALIDKFYIDLREEVVLDGLLKCGIDSGGILKGEYVWAQVKSQMKLIRVGSEIYNSIKEYSEKKKLKPIKSDKFEIGGIYQTINKDRAIYLGKIDSTTFTNDKQYSWRDKRDFSYFNNPITNAKLFFLLSHDSCKSNLLKQLTDASPSKNYQWGSKNHQWLFNDNSFSFIEKINHFELPKNIIDQIRDAHRSYIKEMILSYVDGKIQDYDLDSMITRNSNLINLYRSGDQNKDIFDFKKYFVFI